MDERSDNAEDKGGAEMPQGLIYILADMIIAAEALTCPRSLVQSL